MGKIRENSEAWPPGWKMKPQPDGTIIVSKPMVGGYVAGIKEAGIASEILHALAKDILSQKALEQKKPKTRHCDECHHFRGFEINDLKNPVCKLNHRPKFYLPKSTLDPNWGWKKKCKDFQDFSDDR